MSEIVLQLEGIRKSFGGLLAINDVSFDLSPGQMLGLIGPNGAGKTTIFNMISGIYRVDAGHIRLRGTEITNRQPAEIARMGLARTFQVPRTFNNMTVEENLLVPAVRMGWTKAESARRVEEVLCEVRLAENRKQIASELSSGQRQLLQFARALLTGPHLVMLDEPFGGASPGVIDLIIEKAWALVEAGVACLVISHDIVSLPRICKDVIVLTEGAILTRGSLADVRDDARVIEAYLGA
jgi:branched-chain amino acid transport system ATP-binding protein